MDIMQYKAPQSGLNGFWGRFLKGAINVIGVVVSDVAGRIPIVGDFLKREVETVISKATKWADAIQSRSASPNLTEPTAAEQVILNAWLEKYKVWIAALTEEFGIAASKSTEAAKIAALNVILNKINTVLDHYDINETAGLSKNAVDTRFVILEETLRPIQDAIDNVVASFTGTVSTVSTTFNPASYSFQPLFASTPLISVTGDNYKVAGKSLSTVKPIVNIGNVKPASNPLNTGGTIKNTTLPATVNTPSTIPPVVSAPSATSVPSTIKTGEPAATVPSTTPATTVEDKKSSTGKTLAILAVGAALAYAVFSGPSKPARATKAPARKTAAKRRSTTKKNK